MWGGGGGRRVNEDDGDGLIFLGVFTVGGVKDDGDGCLFGVLLQKSGEGVVKEKNFAEREI